MIDGALRQGSGRRKRGVLRSPITLVLLVALTVAATVVVYLGYPIIASKRRQVTNGSLIVEPGGIAGLQSYTWTPFGPNGGEAANGRQWTSQASSLAVERVYRFSNALSAQYSYVLGNPRKRYDRDFGSLVHHVPVPAGNTADAVEIFCGNDGGSTTPALEKCDIWGYWARYGQYVLALISVGLVMDVEVFRKVVADYDRMVDAKLGK